MAVAELIVSRRALLGAACVAPVLGVAEGPLVRHPGLDPGSQLPFTAAGKGREIPGQARNDGKWEEALARFRAAEAAIAAAQGAPDALFDRVNARFNRALACLLRTPAPGVAALSVKLDLILAHQVWELIFAPSCLAALRRDAERFAATAAG